MIAFVTPPGAAALVPPLVNEWLLHAGTEDYRRPMIGCSGMGWEVAEGRWLSTTNR